MERTRGWTLVEMSVVLSIMGIILYFSVPQFRKAFEQSRVDLAAANLQTIWTAQRLYWTKNRIFADELAILEQSGLLDPGFINRVNGDGSPFLYYIDSADDTGFETFAARRNSSWHGQLMIDEQGSLTGQIEGGDGTVITAVTM
jgi:prepilin-type N-terminal cleavage/methylation domain-containing protein